MSGAPSADYQAVDSIMRRADAMGLDPQRVVRALTHGVAAPTERRAVEEERPRSRFGRRTVGRA